MPIIKTDEKKNGLVKYRVLINYTDTNGIHRRKEKHVYGLAEAKEMEKRLSYELKECTNTRMTISQLVEEYLAIKKTETRESTHLIVSGRFKMHVIPFLGKYRIDKLNAKLIQEWKRHLYEKGLKISSLKNIYIDLKGMFNYAVRMEYLTSNPFNGVSNFKEVTFISNDEAIHYYTIEQFAHYKKVMESNCKTYHQWCCYVFFMIAYYTGARRGEINALKWSDIVGNTIKIRRSVTGNVSDAKMRETLPKNKSSMRDVQMPLPLIKILEEHKSRQKKIPGFSKSFRVCGGTDLLSFPSIKKFHIKIATLANLPIIRVHDFRHSHASLLANNGINIQEIARRLGHSDIKTTWQVYAHLYPSEEDRCLEILNKIE